MSKTTFPILSYQEIRKIIWDVADLVRDKGDGEAADYKRVVLPILTLKRYLDLREEYLNSDIKTSQDYQVLDDDETIVDILSDFMNSHKVYKVDEKHIGWYLVTWENIAEFPKRGENTDYEYTVGSGEDTAVVITKARNKVEFMFEVIKTFEDSSTIRYFEDNEFEVKSVKILGKHFDEVFTLFNDYKFDYEHAEADLFGDAYMDLVGRFAEDEGKKGGQFFTPSTLVENSIELLQPTVKSKETLVADLTAGACTFMTYAAKYLEKEIIKQSEQLDDTTKAEIKKNIKEHLNKRVKFVTQEKDTASELLGMMNMRLHAIENHHSIKGNTITEWKDGFIGDYEGKIDYMYANPPYGLKDYGEAYAKGDGKNEARWNFDTPKKGEGEYAFLASIVNLLNEEGKALVVLPLGTLFKDSTKKIRQKLIEKDWVEGIINLPTNMFFTTGIPVCFWIINKNKAEADKNKIFMVNADQEFKKVEKNNVWQHVKTNKNYIERIVEEGFSEYVSLETLKENDFNLSVSRYVYVEQVREVVDMTALNKEISDLYSSIDDYRQSNQDLFDSMENI